MAAFFTPGRGWVLLFWACAALAFYTFAGYHLLIRWLAARWGRPGAPEPGRGPERASVVLVARNQAPQIGARIRNLLTAPLPLEIIICSDGSTDGTAAAAREVALGEPSIKTLEFPRRRGKAACLSEAIPQAEHEVVVLCDARQSFTPETIPKLLRHFADPEVGAVSGILRIEASQSNTGEGVGAYWRMETALRQAESDFHSCIGCTGAVYAIRREAFQPLPADTVLDDVVIPMRIAAAGFRVLYDDEAEAFDPQALEPAGETRRKTRTLAGNFQMLFRYPGWLLPWRHRLAWQLISHKYLRLAMPWCLFLLLISSLVLAGVAPLYGAAAALQACFYLLAGCGLALPRVKARIFSIPSGIFFLNWMALRALFTYLGGGAGGTWDSAPLPAPEPPR